MENVKEIPPTQEYLPMEERPLRVATYCRVSTQQKEQDSSLELQESRYRRMIEENPSRTYVGIFSEKTTGLNLRGWSVFQTDAVLPEREN